MSLPSFASRLPENRDLVVYPAEADVFVVAGRTVPDVNVR
jgi:hypothetical protein